MSASLAFVIAAVLVIVGVVQLVQGEVLWAVVLFVAAALVGPGGYSILRKGR